MPIETGVSNLLQTYITISQLGAYLPLAGGTMSGDIQMDINNLKFKTTGLDVRIYASASQLLFQDTTTLQTLAGLNKFVGQSDTPANYTGAGSKLVAVNSGATALEFILAPTIQNLGPWEETNKGLVTDWTAGTDIYHSHNAEYYNWIGTTYTTLKTITLDFVPNSTLRIYYEYKAAYQSKWNIFRNGIAVGTEKTYNGAYTSWTENISGWANGDILTVKGKCDAGINCPTNIYCQNLRILCTANKIRNS